jgi:hypothetical protein
MPPCRWVSDSRRTFETSETTLPTTHCHIPEDPNIPIGTSDLLAMFWGSQRRGLWRQVCKYSTTAKCTGIVTRLNIHCELTAVLLLNLILSLCSYFLMVRCDFIDAVLLQCGREQWGESAEGTGRFNLMHTLSGSSVPLLSEQASWSSG